MTVSDIISYVDRVFANDIDMNVKTELIANCDRQLRYDLSRHEKKNGENEPQKAEVYDKDTVLFAPDRYADIYRWYLQARLSLILSQAGMYQTCAALYESTRDEFAKEYNRSHMPIGAVRALKLT